MFEGRSGGSGGGQNDFEQMDRIIRLCDTTGANVFFHRDGSVGRHKRWFAAAMGVWLGVCFQPFMSAMGTVPNERQLI